MNKIIIRKFNNSKIVKIDNTIVEKPTKKRFFRRRIFVDPNNKNMKYDQFPTYAENKQDYLDTLRLVYTGKCKNIFDAYAIHH